MIQDMEDTIPPSTPGQSRRISIVKAIDEALMHTLEGRIARAAYLLGQARMALVILDANEAEALARLDSLADRIRAPRPAAPAIDPAVLAGVHEQFANASRCRSTSIRVPTPWVAAMLAALTP